MAALVKRGSPERAALRSFTTAATGHGSSISIITPATAFKPFSAGSAVPPAPSIRSSHWQPQRGLSVSRAAVIASLRAGRAPIRLRRR